MTYNQAAYRMSLWGRFRIYGPDGSRLNITSKKGMALLAMLATAPGAERSRNWLQSRLWGTRGRTQAQQSLRRELASIRALLPPGDAELIRADYSAVWLDLDRIMVEPATPGSSALFLDGIDIPGESGFESWLREERLRGSAEATAADRPVALPESIVNLNQPAPGFGGRPALAILPFVNATGSSDYDASIQAFGEDLCDRVARLRWLPVIASATMSLIAATGTDAMQIRDRVGADYILSGQLQLAPDGSSLRVRLTDGTNNQLLWSERFDADGPLNTALFDDLFNQLVASLASRIDDNEQTKLIGRRVEDLTVDERVVRARWHMRRLNRDDAAMAKKLLTEAAELRPGALDVLIELAYVLARETWTFRGSASKIEAFRSIAVLARDADPFAARACVVLGMAEMWLGRLDSAIDLFKEAIQLNPSLHAAYGQLGSAYLFSGNPDAAVDPLKTALRLGPFDIEAFYQLGELGLAYFMQGELAAAVEHADYAIARRPAYVYAHAIKIAALVAMGDKAEAAATRARLLKLKPQFTLSNLDWLPFADRRWIDTLKREMNEAAG